MAHAVAITAEPAGKAAQQEDNQDDDEYRSKRHGTLPGKAAGATDITPPRARTKQIPGAFPLPLWGRSDAATSSRRSAAPSAGSRRARRAASRWRSGLFCA